MTRSNKNIIKAALIALVLPLACKQRFLDQQNTFQSNADALSTKREAVIGLVNGIYDTYQNSDLLKKCIWYRANFGAHDFFN